MIGTGMIWKAPEGGWHAYDHDIKTIADMLAVQWFPTRHEAREWIKQRKVLAEDRNS